MQFPEKQKLDFIMIGQASHEKGLFQENVKTI